MEFYLSKALPLLVYPLGLALVLSLLAALVAKSRFARPLILMAVVLLWTASTERFSNLLIQTLERGYPPTPIAQVESAGAIVVLGGSTVETLPGSDSLDLGPAAARVFHAAQLYESGKAPLILVTGGAPRGAPPESEAMAALLVTLGVPAEAIVQESLSRNTWQNTLNSRALLEERGIERVLLVTSAFHMRRALGVFRAAGIDAVPTPTDFRLDRTKPTPVAWLPDAEALYETTLVLKEYLGFAVYQWRGWAR